MQIVRTNLDFIIPALLFDRTATDVALLATLECSIAIALIGAPVAYQWYHIWTSAVAAVGMCVTQGKDGTALIGCKCPKRSLPLSA